MYHLSQTIRKNHGHASICYILFQEEILPLCILVSHIYYTQTFTNLSLAEPFLACLRTSQINNLKSQFYCCEIWDTRNLSKNLSSGWNPLLSFLFCTFNFKAEGNGNTTDFGKLGMNKKLLESGTNLRLISEFMLLDIYLIITKD